LVAADIEEVAKLAHINLHAEEIDVTNVIRQIE
jgi:hypothetical protein